MHGKAARRLGDAAEQARHALLAGDAQGAVRACLAAGRRCLALFATADAHALAERGLSYVGALPQPDACVLELQLRELSLFARRSEDPRGLAERIGALAAQALALGELDQARRGFYLNAFLLWEHGEVVDAQRFSREAERCSRLGTKAERLRGLAHAAHCLVVLERDLTDAQAFVLEAEALIAAGEPPLARVCLVRGALELHRGELEDAAGALERARDLAAAQADRLTEFYALECAIEVELARRRWEVLDEKVALLVALGEGRAGSSELPYALALRELVRYARERENTLADALERLELADAKQRCACVRLHCAELALSRGDDARARTQATRALELAEAVARNSEIMRARALLLALAQRAGEDEEEARALLAGISGGSAYARARRDQVLATSERRESKGRGTWNT